MGKSRQSHSRSKTTKSKSFAEPQAPVNATIGSHAGGSPQVKAADQSLTVPSPWVRILFSMAVLVQFGGLYLALSSNLFQSRLQQELMATAAPFLVSTGQQYGTQPLELTHAEAFDLPLQVEFLISGANEWKPLEFSAGGSFSRWPNLARRLRLIIEDDIESEILADFAHQFAQLHEQANASGSIEAIRFVQPFTPNFDEGSALAEGRGGLLDTNAQVLYSAQAIRNGERLVGFVPTQESYRSSKSVEASVPSTSK